MFQVVFQFGGIYLDTDTISVQPLRGRLSESFVAFRLAPYFNIQSSIFGFPKVRINIFFEIAIHQIFLGFLLP